jgi:hypothetical protein
MMNEEGNKMLKFEGKFSIGDYVRAYDFKPRPDVSELYVEGYIREISRDGYVIEVVKDTVFKHRTEIVAPFEVFFMEFDNRISLTSV